MGLPLDSKTIKIQAMRQIGAINTKEKIEKIIKKIYFLKNTIAIRFIAGYN